MFRNALASQVINDHQHFHWESFLMSSSVSLCYLVIKITHQAYENSYVQEGWTDVLLQLQ